MLGDFFVYPLASLNPYLDIQIPCIDWYRQQQHQTIVQYYYDSDPLEGISLEWQLMVHHQFHYISEIYLINTNKKLRKLTRNKTNIYLPISQIQSIFESIIFNYSNRIQ